MVLSVIQVCEEEIKNIIRGIKCTSEKVVAHIVCKKRGKGRKGKQDSISKIK